MHKYIESRCSVAGGEGPGRSSQLISYSLIVRKSFFPSELITDSSPTVLFVALFFFSFFLAHHELVFSLLKFTMDAFLNKTHTNLLQRVSLLETQRCSSLGGNVPFLCLCRAIASCLPDRMTVGHNHLFRIMF